MKKTKKVFKNIVLILLCSLIMVPAGYAKKKIPNDTEVYEKIVTFHGYIGWKKIEQYLRVWEKKGVAVVMELPVINSLVLNVPEGITSEDLADSPYVKTVENDWPVKLKMLVESQSNDSSIDDGDVDTYGNFIAPFETPPEDNYPWGVLSLYGQDYDPVSPVSPYDAGSLSEPVVRALKRMYKRYFNGNFQKKIKIAIFDTGIQYYHSRLFNAVEKGIDIVNGSDVPLDDNGHGTHVAGIVAATLDMDGEWGKRAPAIIYPVKVLDNRATGSLSNIIKGIQWAIDNGIHVINMSIAYQNSSPAIHDAIKAAHDAGIVIVASVGNQSNFDENFVLASDGGSADGGSADGGSADGGSADGGSADGGSADGGSADGGSADGGSADGGSADGGSADGGSADGGSADGGSADGGSADGGSADGGSADNGGTENSIPLFSVMYPARYPEVIAVGASTPSARLAPYSNFGKELDLLAPGSMVVSADVTNGNEIDGFGICSGTSQAAPHVTAAVAMMLVLNPNYTPEEIRTILLETSNLTVDGYRSINLIKALERVMAENELLEY